MLTYTCLADLWPSVGRAGRERVYKVVGQTERAQLPPTLLIDQIVGGLPSLKYREFTQFPVVVRFPSVCMA